eukprot:scaffold3350_cov268-Pinguiococcus_pyrenoidosus.AAC.37
MITASRRVEQGVTWPGDTEPAEGPGSSRHVRVRQQGRGGCVRCGGQGSVARVHAQLGPARRVQPGSAQEQRRPRRGTGRHGSEAPAGAPQATQ